MKAVSMILRKAFLVSLISGVLFTMQAQAGRESGGGHAIQAGGNTYLFDFFEGGIESRVILGGLCRPDSSLVARIAGSLDVDEEMARQVGCKISEIARVAPRVASVLTQTLLTYQWQRVQPELMSRYDFGVSPIRDLGTGLILLQAALRFDDLRVVYINRSIWSALPLEHRIGLIFHEALFAVYSNRYQSLVRRGTHPASRYRFVVRNFSSSGEYCEQVIPSSSASRTLNVYLFSRAIQVSSTEVFEAKWKDFMRDAETRYSIVDLCQNQILN